MGKLQYELYVDRVDILGIIRGGLQFTQNCCALSLII